MLTLTKAQKTVLIRWLRHYEFQRQRYTWVMAPLNRLFYASFGPWTRNAIFDLAVQQFPGPDYDGCRMNMLADLVETWETTD